MRLLAEAAQEVRQLALVGCRQDLGGRATPRGVEAHVERAAGPDSEASSAIGQLEAREPEIEQDAIDLPEAHRSRFGGEVPEVGLPKNQPVAETGQALPDPRNRRRVGIESQQPTIRAGGFQDPLGVPTAAEGGVDLEAAGARGEHVHDLLHQHRQVPSLHLSSTIDGRIPSGSWKRMWS